MEKVNERILRKPELFNRIQLSDPTIWRLEKQGKFPRRLRLGGASVGWLESEILDWLQKKADARQSVSENSGGAREMNPADLDQK